MSPLKAYSLFWRSKSKFSILTTMQGHANIEAEIEKAKKKLDKINEHIQRQEKSMSGKDYQTKVKDSVKEVDAGKLADSKAEADTITQLIEKLEKLKA